MKNNLIKILFIGDIVGKPGRKAVADFLKTERENFDFIFANGENLAGGSGITFEKYEEMLNLGIDYFTSGNHIWAKAEIIPYLKEKSVKILRPANYGDDAPGLSVVEIEKNGVKIVLANLLGRVFINQLVEDPFETADNIMADYKNSTVIFDFHAEATSEKIALAHYLDGRALAVFGSHTHVQTADESILPKGTAFISDMGMCGPENSVLGVEKDIIIKQFLTGLPQSYKVASGEAIFNAVALEVDLKKKVVLNIERVCKNSQHN